MFITDRNKYLVASSSCSEWNLIPYPNLQGSSRPDLPPINWFHLLPLSPASLAYSPFAHTADLVHTSAFELCTYYFLYMELYCSRSLIKCHLPIVAYLLFKKLASPANRNSPGHFPALLLLEHFSPPYIWQWYTYWLVAHFA